MRMLDKNMDTGKVVIEDDRNIRCLYVDGSLESAIYLRKEKKKDLVFPYLRALKYPMSLVQGKKEVYLIGSGGFCYPYTFLHEEEGNITSAEMSKDIIECARTYFYLKEIEEDPRFTLIQGDGFSYLEKCEKTFDVIINDAFIGKHPVGLDEKNTKNIQEHLSYRGIYVINYVASIEEESIQQQLDILEKYFKYSTVMIVDDEIEQEEKQNMLMMCSNTDYGW